ncbi:MAG: hypothetical protein Kow00121_19840 [Elainellaceae cyanobacterium]
MDAWVIARIRQVQNEFEQRPTVKERNIYISIPIELNGNKSAISDFSASNLKPVFAKRSIRILIWGEGGVGKTSLACQVAKWVMAEDKSERPCKHHILPVLIEEELGEGEGQTPLLEAIARQIKNLRDDEKPVPEELLRQLLEKRRILVIVDHLSEMSNATRKAINLKDASFPVNALIVTSRVEGILGTELTQTMLKPLRVSGKQLSIFMDVYLNQRGKRDLFDDVEYFDALRRLSQIVTDDRNITVLFAKLYADQMIAIAEGLVAEDLPDNVPNLMLSYVNKLNHYELEDRLEDEIIQRDAKIIAWECLRHTFRPGMAEREQIITSLTALENNSEAVRENAIKRLQYLEKRLFLIRTIPPTKTKIRFTLDPLAEYLAGLHLVNAYSGDEQTWQTFLDEAKDKSGNLDEIKGFCLAVRDCCIARSTEIKIFAFVAEALGKLAGLDLEALEQEQLRHRVRRLISNLSLPHPEDRLFAAFALEGIGVDAKAAVPALIKALRDPNADVREKAAEALGEIGSAAKPAVQELITAFNEKLLSSPAALGALRKIGAAAQAAVPFLISTLESSRDWGTLRQAAAALGRVNPELAVKVPAFNKFVDDLIENLPLDPLTSKRSEYRVRKYAIVLGEIGSAARTAVPYMIKALQAFIDHKQFDSDCEDLVTALGEIGPPAKDAVPFLIGLLEEKRSSLGIKVAEALEKIGDKSEPVFLALTNASRSKDFFVREAADEALRQLLSQGKK